ncbi:hypothetical protein SAMN05660862_2511 [Sphingobacterium psychroaquaticum]|uniref:Uncharacterized protein n=1 Tax=Sphingobacterium psychroaquaticum TaxID=561061 RepID=A0A1X7K538_9SPHI|nr:hypothetical protein SAMN05660862_2511 [Sphingobacterium psychroaquaticum]
MIRFINLTSQIYLDKRPCFSFFCTITDTFLILDGNQYWESLEDFEDSYLAEKDKPEWNVETHPLSRFTNLIPKGFFRYNKAIIE